VGALAGKSQSSIACDGGRSDIVLACYWAAEAIALLIATASITAVVKQDAERR
jgi:hypothetical protein